MNFLSDKMIELWLIPGEPEPQAISRYLGLLSDAERSRHDRFLFPADRQRFLLTRAAIRTLLSHYCPQLEPGQWRFSDNGHGRPLVANTELSGRLYFSISHSEGLIAIAFARAECIGLDVENTTLDRQTLAVADRFFAPSEVRALAALPAELKRDRFYDLWTLKEAYIKACGLGLAIPLKQFAYAFPDEESVAIRFSAEREDEPSRWFFTVLAWRQYRLALALAGEGDKQGLQLSCRGWHPEFGASDLNLASLRDSRKSLP